MEDSSARKKNWKLTKEALDGMLAHLAPGPEKASEEFKVLRLKLVRFFEWRNGPDPEDHAWETITRVCRRLSEGEVVEDVTKYAYGVARFVHREILKKLEEEREALKHLPSPDQQSEEFQDPALLRCYESCLNELSSKDRDLIVRYYQNEKGEKIKNRRQLAEDEGIPLNALRIRTHRIRERLERCIEECLDSPPRE